MEFLVTMTTHVPDGTSEAAVQDIRASEAAHSLGLASQGRLLRLWRPPLQPGAWRTLGLFDAKDDMDLEEILAAMPLRVWRTDDVTSLLPHPNDPIWRGRRSETSGPGAGNLEFFTQFTLTVPAGTPSDAAAARSAQEAARARELAGEGHLLRLWALPGRGRTLGLWRTHDAADMETIVASLPLHRWMTTEITPLSPHPSDPGIPET
jgi:muconolactone delta-isomerase